MPFKWPWDWSNPYDEPYTDPFETGKLPTVVHPAVVTRRGRVVYDRRLHPFSEADLIRIAGNVLLVPKDNNNQWDYLALLERLTIWMLEKILDLALSRSSAEIAAPVLYSIVHRFLTRIFDKLTPEYQDTIRADLDVGGVK